MATKKKTASKSSAPKASAIEDVSKKTKFCASCGKKVHESAKSCPNCGFVFRQEEEFVGSKTGAIVGLILNILVWPGLGTIIGGETKKGIWQIVLFLISLPLILVLIGIPMLIGIWIWALVTSIQQISKFD